MYKRDFTLIIFNLFLNLYRYEEPKVKVVRKIAAKTSFFQSSTLSKLNINDNNINNNNNNNINNNNNNNRQVYYSKKKKILTWQLRYGKWKKRKSCGKVSPLHKPKSCRIRGREVYSE